MAAEQRLDTFARGQVLGQVQLLLSRAGVVGVVPTPLEVVADLAGVRETIDISQLPAELIAAKPSWWKRLIGAYLYKAEAMFVDWDLPNARVRFTQAHEVGHRLLPWHEAAYHLDDQRILGFVGERLEQEANLAAAYLLFQGLEMNRLAGDLETGIRAPLTLAGRFGASRHATIRHYVDHHPEAVALLVIGQYPNGQGRLPILMYSQSGGFESRFGQARDHLCSPSVVPLGDLISLSFAELQAQAKLEGTSEMDEVELRDLDGQRHAFGLEVHFNGRVHLAMLSPKRRIRLGRRIVSVSKPESRLTLTRAAVEP